MNLRSSQSPRCTWTDGERENQRIHHWQIWVLNTDFLISNTEVTSLHQLPLGSFTTKFWQKKPKGRQPIPLRTFHRPFWKYFHQFQSLSKIPWQLRGHLITPRIAEAENHGIIDLDLEEVSEIISSKPLILQMSSGELRIQKRCVDPELQTIGAFNCSAGLLSILGKPGRAPLSSSFLAKQITISCIRNKPHDNISFKWRTWVQSQRKSKWNNYKLSKQKDLGWKQFQVQLGKLA